MTQNRFKCKILLEGNACNLQPSLKGETTDVVVFYKANFSLNRAICVLLNISLKLPLGLLTLVVGPVGSGKSLLLKAIIGDIHCTDGYIQM